MKNVLLDNWIGWIQQRIPEAKKGANKFWLRQAMEGYCEDYIKTLNLPDIISCDFKTQIALYEGVDSILAVSDQILPIHKGDKMTIKGTYYLVEYVDYDFDREIFEIVVSDDS